MKTKTIRSQIAAFGIVFIIAGGVLAAGLFAWGAAEAVSWAHHKWFSQPHADPNNPWLREGPVP
jgi:hypothetical protein